jgi:transcriptional regulator with XRE-family HTH domain
VNFAKKDVVQAAHLARVDRAVQGIGQWQPIDVLHHTLSRRRLDPSTFQALQTLLASGGLRVGQRLAAAIRARREHLLLTTRAFGEKAGLSAGEVEAIERCGVDLSPSDLVRLSNALQVDLVWFIENDPSAFSGQARGAFDLDNDLPDAHEGLELLQAFASIADPEARKAVLELAHKLAQREIPGGEPNDE